MQEWITLSDMTLARTEHGLAVINGIPTVVGGVAEDEFLASVEQLDSSNDQDIAYQRQWRLVAQVGLGTNRYHSQSIILPGSLCSKIRLRCGSDTNQQNQQRSCLQSSLIKKHKSLRSVQLSSVQYICICITSRFLDFRLLETKPKNHYYY